MKYRYLVLLTLILFSAAIIAGVGLYLKYDVIRPLGLTDYQDKSVFELPFIYFSDPVLQFMVENAHLMMQPDDTQPSDEPTDSTSTQPTDPTHTIPPATSTDPTFPTVTPPTTLPTVDPNLTPMDPGFRYPTDSVQESWFHNTLFIGDSRTVGLRDYARFSGASYFCDVGMTVYSVWENSLSDVSFSKTTLEALLKSKRFDKIFINFGLNECGYPYNGFTLAYKNFVQKVRQHQPDAVIVLQGIMSVTPGKAAQGDYFSPASLQKRNNYISSLADGKKTFYVDVNLYFTDENGFLLASITNDGYHPTATGYKKWKEWIAYAAGTLGV